MPPKGGNAKKEGGRAKKAENEERKAAAEEQSKAAKEADEWKAGAKGSSKAEVAAAKAAEAAKKKAEKEALLAAEEAALPSKPKAAPKAGAKKKPTADPILRPTAGGGIAAFSVNDPLNLMGGRDDNEPVEELSATGIEEMLEAMELVNQRTDNQAMGAKAGLIEKHPERRVKAAFEAYMDVELPKLKEDRPGLRLNQMKEILFKQFQKAPENPRNQVQVAYNATKEERLGKLKEVTDSREAKYKVST